MEQKLFNLDSMPDCAFEGYCFPNDDWNGFERPYFTREVAESILRQMFFKGLINGFVFNTHAKVVFVEDIKPLPDGTENVMSFKPVTVAPTEDGEFVELWPIGTAYWCWWDVTTEWDSMNLGGYSKYIMLMSDMSARCANALQEYYGIPFITDADLAYIKRVLHD